MTFPIKLMFVFSRWRAAEGGGGRSGGDCFISQNEKLPQIIFLFNYHPIGTSLNKTHALITRDEIIAENWGLWQHLGAEETTREWASPGGQISSISQANMVTQRAELNITNYIDSPALDMESSVQVCHSSDRITITRVRPSGLRSHRGPSSE